MTTTDPRTTRTAATALLAAAALTLAGCGADEAETGAQPEVADAVPAAPEAGAYDAEFSDELARTGEEVTISAQVDDVISTRALAAGDPDDQTLDPLLVVHDLDLPDLEEGAVLEVTGTARADLDITTVEEELGLDLDDALLEDHLGEPWLHATEITVTEDE